MSKRVILSMLGALPLVWAAAGAAHARPQAAASPDACDAGEFEWGAPALMQRAVLATPETVARA